MWASKGRGNHKPTLIEFQDYEYGDAPLSPMYKPFFDVSEMSEWNLAHVNAYKTTIKIQDGNMEQIEVDLSSESNMGWFYDDFVDTGYHQHIKDYESKKESDGKIETKVEMMNTDDGTALHRSSKNYDKLEKVIFIYL